MPLQPTVNLVLFFSFYSGRTLHTNDPYVTSFLQSWGKFFAYELDCVGGILDSVANTIG